MRTHRIYLPEAQHSGQITPLPESAFGHLVRVLRQRAGDPFEVFNGQGQRFRAELTEVGKKQASALLVEALDALPESPLHTHLGLVMSKGDRFDYALQKATELGVSTITPLDSERCDLRLKADRQEKKQQHWQGVITSACEQCGRDTVPLLNPTTSLLDWLQQDSDAFKLVLHTSATAPAWPEQAPQRVRFLVGPEGGLTEAEITTATQQGYQAWQLGPRIFRTETAPVAMLAILQQRWGDF
ncbi:MAG: 16S rRNA (uracil(1498)-N(3))-methyltransferase [Saccharospirillum sp.]|nr:16S rRNA (uracil(1498)-N(3))-methyltransferase [Saccharospirillum sp.]